MSQLEARATKGLHQFLVTAVLRRIARKGRAVDLGAGSGALAMELQALGMDVVAVDIDRRGFGAEGCGPEFLELDLNGGNFSQSVGEQAFDVVTAVEIIEHVENPIAFLRNVQRLLMPDGIAVVTTPNIQNVAARIKFLLTGKVRMMDEQGDPSHISPIVWDLFVRQYLPRAGLRLKEHLLFPPDRLAATRGRYMPMVKALALILQGPGVLGDNHVAVLELSS